MVNLAASLHSVFSGGVTFLARRTYHDDRLALNREALRIFRVKPGDYCVRGGGPGVNYEPA